MPPKRRGAQRAGTGAAWARGFFTGLASGGLTAAIVYFSVLSKNPDALPAGTPKPADADSAKAVGGPKPKFEFYTILPELEVPVPDQPSGDTRQASVPPALQTPPLPPIQGKVAPGAAGAPTPPLPAPQALPPVAPPATSGGRYILQAGSSRNAADAERLRAGLALQGMVAQVQQVAINGETWHRIRVGPFGSRTDADAAQRQLHAAKINTMLLELRAP
jgi:cell division septation protein DedD